MGKPELTRREMLAGLAGASGVGAGLGSGTAAVVSDDAIFPLGSITAGRLEMDVERTDGGGSGPAGRIELDDQRPEHTIEVTVSLPELVDDSNNPARVWVGVQCGPVDSPITEALEVTIRRRNCESGCTEFEGSLSELEDGVAIEAPDGDCLEPGESVDLDIEVSVPGYVGTSSDSVTFEFVGTQCRNGGDARNPFEGSNDCGTDSHDPKKGISFVGFCSSEEPLEPTITGKTFLPSDGEDGSNAEVGSVTWSTETDVDFVVVKAGQIYTIYDHTDYRRTEGKVSSGDPSAAIPGIEPDKPKDMGMKGSNSWASRYCELAAHERGFDGELPASTKLERENGDWVVE